MTKQTQEALKMAIEAIENLIKVKGRHHTEIATLKLFNDVLPALKEALEQPAQGIELEWISVKNRQPKPYVAVLVARFDGEYWTISKDAYQWGANYAYDREANKNKVSHWMPLPNPPKEQL